MADSYCRCPRSDFALTFAKLSQRGTLNSGTRLVLVLQNICARSGLWIFGGNAQESWEIFHSDICSAKIKKLGQDGRVLADAWYSTDGSAWSQAGSLGFG